MTTWESVRFEYETYAACDRAVFHATLLRTYQHTLDCPEVNGVRTVEEIIEGHRNQGVHDPNRWWLAWHERTPVGVLLMTEMPEWGSWDVAYVGVVAAARGRGFGRELTLKALYEARAAAQTQVTLAVDARNEPAWDLYRAAGFEAYDQREVRFSAGSSTRSSPRRAQATSKGCSRYSTRMSSSGRTSASPGPVAAPGN